MEGAGMIAKENAPEGAGTPNESKYQNTTKLFYKI